MAITVEDLRSRVQPWCVPISSTAPGGTDASTDARYLKVTEEIAKLESAGASPPRWPIVVSCGRELLCERAKDFRVACYVAHALGFLAGLAGLADGCMLVAELLDRYWVEMFPPVPRLRGRVNSLAWFVEHGARQVEALDVQAGDRVALEALCVATRHLAEVARRRFGDQTPAFRPLTDAADRRRVDLASSVGSGAGSSTLKDSCAADLPPVLISPDIGTGGSSKSSDLPSALWGFAHLALSPEFHRDPRRFVATLDDPGGAHGAERDLPSASMLANMWNWARQGARLGAPERPPLTYHVQRTGLFVFLEMRFRDVVDTGAPWAIMFVIKNGDLAQPPIFARVFLLECSAHSSACEGRTVGILCESAAGRVHRNWGTLLPPDDLIGFRNAVYDVLKKTEPPKSETPVSVKLDSREDGLWFGRIDDSLVRSAKRWRVRVSTQGSPPGDLGTIPALAKVASWSDITESVGRSDPLPFKPATSPFPAPGEVGEAWFQIDHPTRWPAVMAEKTVAIYLPPPWNPGRIRVELWALCVPD